MSETRQNPRIVIHVDMDAFYAAVEELDHPEYRGKPLVVGADPKGGYGRGVVSTCNYAARKYGIHSAMPISQAYRLCPQAIYVGGSLRRYGEVSKKIMEILADYSPQIMQISIDEAFLDVTQTAKGFGGGLALAQHLKARIREETGLTASVGMASNMFIAKVASDMQKPDGLTVCPAGEEKQFLAGLPVSRLWGVGPKTESRLRDLGFKTIGDLARFPRAELAKRFGVWGNHLWELANGIDRRSVEDWGPRKSISQEYTFEEDVADPAVVEERLWAIADGLSADMRREKLKGRVLTLKIRLEGFLTFTRRQTLGEYTNDAEILREIALELFRHFDREDKRVRLIGVAMSQLNTQGGEQLHLFASEGQQHREKVAQLLDRVRARFGGEAAKRASLLDDEPHRFLGAEQVPQRSGHD